MSMQKKMCSDYWLCLEKFKFQQSIRPCIFNIHGFGVAFDVFLADNTRRNEVGTQGINQLQAFI